MTSPLVSRRLAGFQAVRYGPHESVLTPEDAAAQGADKLVARPGDFILTHSTGVYGRLIRFGQALRYRGPDKAFAHWSHAAIFVDDSGNIIEALGGGVQKRNISVYDGTEYVVVHLPTATHEWVMWTFVSPDRDGLERLSGVPITFTDPDSES